MASDNGGASRDPLRDSFLRYFGYANEVGEAFRPLIPRSIVRLSYGVAIGYVLADVGSKTKETYEGNKKVKNAAITALDVFLWQLFASVIIPGFTINRITALSGRLLRNSKKTNEAIKRLGPTAIGLISIPFIVKPIDAFVTYTMDETYRKHVKS
ncbi:mitochondrial fission process protein 1-like isoform X2 [Hermetia illucens]|uniref:mitochondrial fission process protein 1-like isoform X2 n=1 Tax=Hermetia illucens TaxID=343691 RepID=UPI0018CC39D4|nr:mitochondrial fission process protein 1-like isoform X2 [Hermetia illucens]